MIVLDKPALAKAFADDPRVQLAVLFGSSRDGVVRPGSDVDVGVLLSLPFSPLDFYLNGTQSQAAPRTARP